VRESRWPLACAVMGIENPVHLAFLAVVALLVLGPRRLPEMARALGRGIREFRDAMSLDDDRPIEHAPIVAEPPLAAPAPEWQPQGDPLADSFTHAQAAHADPAPARPQDVQAEVDPARPIPSGDAPDGRTL